MMPLSVGWYDNEHSIIKVTITADTTWEAYHQAIDWLVAEAKKVNHRVDIIFHDDVGMPNGNALYHLKAGSTKIINQPNIQHSIVAGTQGRAGFTLRIFEVLGRSFMRMPRSSSKGKLLFMRSLDEALAYIAQDRAEVGTPERCV